MTDTSQAGAPAATRDDRQQWAALMRHRGVRVLLALGLLAVAATAALGGFRKSGGAVAARLPVLSAGQRAESGAFAITPLSAWVADAEPGQSPGIRRYLVLRMRAENLTGTAFAASALLQQDVVWLPTGRGNERKAEPMRRADDHTLFVLLQPGQPTVIDIAWELPAGAAPPTRAVWGVYARDYIERGYLQGDGDAGWRQTQPGFKLELDTGAPPAGAVRG